MPYYASDLLALTPKPWDGPWSANEIIFGRSRPTLNPNVKPPAEVGKVRSWGTQHIPPGHTHGDPTPKDGLTARDMTSVWLGPNGPEVGVSRARAAAMGREEAPQPAGPDFLAMNRGAVAAGAITARDVSAYRMARPQQKLRQPSQRMQRVDPAATTTQGDMTAVGAGVKDMMERRPEREWLKFMFEHEKKRLAAEAAAERSRSRAHPGPAIAAATAVGRDRRSSYVSESLRRSGTHITSVSHRMRPPHLEAVQPRVDAPRDWHPGTLAPAADSIYNVDFLPAAGASRAAIDGVSTVVPARRNPPARLDEAPTLQSRLDGYRAETIGPRTNLVHPDAPGAAAILQATGSPSVGRSVRGIGTVLPPAAMSRAPILDHPSGYGGGGARMGYRFDPSAVPPGVPAGAAPQSLAGTSLRRSVSAGAGPRQRRMPRVDKPPVREAYTGTYEAPAQLDRYPVDYPATGGDAPGPMTRRLHADFADTNADGIYAAEVGGLAATGRPVTPLGLPPLDVEVGSPVGSAVNMVRQRRFGA
eukprot:TRINITY_DN4816_c0_g1_i1.p1 TRINITY_DN4816_c0_g1~~TRINITY_DN4816_c0_g1_i1.p1  ORF type:complete len:530 (-),score=74.88 TRINITY_DN4816_c0_g1_i1:364-1953(-)